MSFKIMNVSLSILLINKIMLACIHLVNLNEHAREFMHVQ